MWGEVTRGLVTYCLAVVACKAVCLRYEVLMSFGQCRLVLHWNFKSENMSNRENCKEKITCGPSIDMSFLPLSCHIAFVNYVILLSSISELCNMLSDWC